MRAQFNVETIAALTIDANNVYPKNPIFLNPFYGVLIPEDQVQYVSSTPKFLNSVFHSETFRKMMTIYSECKLESMMVSATPLDFNARIGEFNTLTMYHTWDRKGKDFDGSSTFGTGVDASSKMKAASNEQGGRKTIIADTKGSFSHLTGCVASSMQERSGWMDTHTIEGATEYIGAGSAAKYAHTFVLAAENLNISNTGSGSSTHMAVSRNLSTIQPYFIPCCWITIMSNYPAQTTFTTRVMLRCKYSILFRNPGPVDTGAGAINLMLKENIDLAPASSGWTIKSAPTERSKMGDDVGSGELNYYEEEEEEDMDTQPATKLRRTDTKMLGEDDELL